MLSPSEQFLKSEFGCRVIGYLFLAVQNAWSGLLSLVVIELAQARCQLS